MTHLGNRLRLEEDLDVLQARSRRYGHPAGDRVLVHSLRPAPELRFTRNVAR